MCPGLRQQPATALGTYVYMVVTVLRDVDVPVQNPSLSTVAHLENETICTGGACTVTHFFSNFICFYPKIHHKSTKIDQTSIKIRSKSGLGPQKGPKSLPRIFQAQKQDQSLPPPWLPFGRLLESMLAPRATKRPLKVHAKVWSILIFIFHRFFSDSGGIFTGFWEPCWHPRCSKN